jgi:hypothetical protein
MESIELDVPIIVNIVEKDMSTITAKYVFTNTKDNRSILSKLSTDWTSKEKSQLAKAYPQINITSAGIYGGDDGGVSDNQVIEEIMFDDGLLIDDTSIVFDEEDIRNITDTTSVRSSEIFDTSSSTPITQSQKSVDASKIPQMKQKTIAHKGVKFANTTLYKTDSVNAFRQKLYLETGIPPYRQHLWIMFNNRPFQLSYRIKHETYQTVDITETQYIDTVLEGIPTDTLWYASKEFITVESNEHITLSQIVAKYQVVEINCVDLSSFIPSDNISTIARLIKNDSYAYDLIYWGFIVKYYPMMSQSVFKEYITNPNVMKVQYPLIHPPRKLLNDKFNMEKKLLSQTPPVVLPNMIKMNIINSVVIVRSRYIHADDDIVLRNLFDKFHLNETIHTCICNTQFDGNRVTLIKRHSSQLDTKYTHLPSNTIQYSTTIPKYGNVDIQINKTGSYKIIGNWIDGSELMFMDVFKVLTDHIMPIITSINAFGSAISTQHIEPISIGNAYFTNINMSLYVKQVVTTAQFKQLRQHIDQFVNAGIMERVELDSTVLHYYQLKGVFMHDMNKYRVNAPMSNEYAPMYDSVAKHKWDMFITKKKSVKITRRFSDVKIEVEGLREEEFKTWYTFLQLMISPLLEKQTKTNKDTQNNVETSSMRIRHMKEMDPALYDLKKLYGKKIVYSQVCQKQHQPNIHDAAGDGRTKYWNFTNNEPMWYSCPDPQYPHLYFKTGVHPLDYCMPCCKKKAIDLENTEDKQTRQYSQCIETHEYKKSKVSTTRSRYVKTYSNFLSPGRISRLPEDTLEPLMYDNFSLMSTGMDEECTTRDKGYYIFGVPQHTDSVNNIGFIYCVSESMGMKFAQFVSESIIKIQTAKNWFVLLSGQITHHFTTQNELIDEMTNALLNHKLSMFTHWNELFRHITKLYWGLNVIVFVDRDASISTDDNATSDSDIHLYIPSGIKYVRDLISSKHSLIVINRGQTYYPIYMMYTNIYFKSGQIETKLFDGNTHAVTSVKNIVKYYLKKWSSVVNVSIDLYIILYFVKHNKDTEITKLFINDLNMCYGVQLLVGKKDIAYIPVAYSIYYSGYELTFDIMGPSNSTRWGVLKPLLVRINKSITQYSMDKLGAKEGDYIKPVYPHITSKMWKSVTGSKNVLGFTSQSLLFYVTDPPPKKEMHQLSYYTIDPHIANAAIRERKQPSNDTRTKSIDRSIYNQYLYQILFLTFIDIIHSHRNTKIRSAIQNLIPKKGVMKLNIQLVESLRSILADHPVDLHNIIRIVTNAEPLDVLNNSFLEFDKYMIRELVQMSLKDCTAAVRKLLSPHLVIGQPSTDSPMPNMLASCIMNRDDNIPYCSDKKLIIPKEKLDEYIDILVMDIRNPLKAVYLTMYTFIPRSVDYFNFIERHDEQIFITM